MTQERDSIELSILRPAQTPDHHTAPVAAPAPSINQLSTDPPEEEYNLLGFRSSCLQRCRCFSCPRWFLFFICVASFGQSMSTNGLIGVSISSLEKRYGFSSTMSSWILVAYELAGVPPLIVVGYIGAHVHRPRWISGGLCVFLLGLFVFMIPQLAAPPYHIGADVEHDNYCTAAGRLRNGSNYCNGEMHDTGSLKGYLYVFLLAAVLLAIGGVPLYVLGLTYIYDALSNSTAAMYLGICYSMSVLGPAAAYVGGGYLLRVYVDVGKIDTSSLSINDKDARWIGAWWLGFVVAMIIMSVPILPILGFPAKLPGGNKTEQETSDLQTVPDLQYAMQPGFGSSARDIPRLLRLIFLNYPFVCTMLYTTFDAMLVSGFQTFGPKYMQQQFTISASSAGLLFGAVAVPGAAGGCLFGSYLIHRINLSCRQLLRLQLLLSIVSTITIFGMLIQCDSPSIAMLTDEHSYMKYPCNANCSCSMERFDPVCGAEVTYFSPCYAGCRVVTLSPSRTPSYSSCWCIHDTSPQLAPVTKGVCRLSDCATWHLVTFVCVFLVAIFCMFACAMFHLSLLFRIVPVHQRPMAYSFDWILVRFLGLTLGPLILGIGLDSSCLLIERKCGPDRTGSCLNYENRRMAVVAMTFYACCKVLNIAFGCLALITYRPLSQSGVATLGGRGEIKRSETSTSITASNPSVKTASNPSLTTATAPNLSLTNVS